VQKFWGVLFGVVLMACFLSLLLSPSMGWWLPPNVASFGGEIDYLFYIILFFTGFFFVLTEVLLVYAMLKWDHSPERRAVYVEGHNKLEAFWTIVPAAILLYIAFAQIPAWAQIKYQSRMPTPEKVAAGDYQVVGVTARQWEWRLRYPTDVVPGNERDWAEHADPTDILGVNELHIWKGAKVKVYLKTQDVLHSFFMPNLRIKQDAVPGKTIPMWFEATEANCRWDNARKQTVLTDANGKDRDDKSREWEIACAELCGTRHYGMRGKLYVHPSRADFENWLKHERQRQNSYGQEK
jgi:cytochrome c oxidase subunit 2